MTELQILSAIKNNGGTIDYAQLINLGRTDTGWDPVTDKRLIQKLIQQQILSGKTDAYSTITFGTKGLLRYKELKQLEDDLANQVADKKSEKNSNRRFQLLNTILGAVIGAIVTILIQLIFGLL